MKQLKENLKKQKKTKINKQITGFSSPSFSCSPFNWKELRQAHPFDTPSQMASRSMCQ